MRVKRAVKQESIVEAFGLRVAESYVKCLAAAFTVEALCAGDDFSGALRGLFELQKGSNCSVKALLGVQGFPRNKERQALSMSAFSGFSRRICKRLALSRSIFPRTDEARTQRRAISSQYKSGSSPGRVTLFAPGTRAGGVVCERCERRKSRAETTKIIALPLVLGPVPPPFPLQKTGCHTEAKGLRKRASIPFAVVAGEIPG